jgi:chromosome transmission fidelity protein 18
MTKVLAVNDWLTFTDVVTATIHKSQAFALMAYQPFAMVACHEQFAAQTKHVVRYPNLFWNATQKENETRRTLDGMLDECNPMIRRMVNQQIVSLDLVSPLLDLVSPAIRPVAPALLSPREKSVLEGVIRTMLAYNLSYKQTRNAHASYSYTLDPPIDELAKFADEGFPPPVRQAWKEAAAPPKESAKVAARNKRLTYNTKQLICQEIVQRQMGSMENDDDRGDATAAAQFKEPAARAAAVVAPIARSPTSRAKAEKAEAFLKARMGIQMDHVTVKTSNSLNVDFFGRAKSEPEPLTLSQVAQLPAAPRVFFKFQEGFSNAVKKPLRLRDLL